MKTGVYVDFDNIASNGLGSLNFSAVRRHYEGAGLVTQAHVYLAHHEELEKTSQKYASWRKGVRLRLEQSGFLQHVKTPKVYQSAAGEITTKANCDVELTVDVMLHSGRLDRVVLMTGDGDFVRLVRALQDMSVWVEVAAAAGISQELAKAANSVLNPLLIPEAHFSNEYSFKTIFRVLAFNLREMTISTERLAKAPTSSSPTDCAWERSDIPATSEMWDSKRFTPGKIIGWTGADGLSAYHELF